MKGMFKGVVAGALLFGASLAAGTPAAAAKAETAPAPEPEATMDWGSSWGSGFVPCDPISLSDYGGHAAITIEMPQGFYVAKMAYVDDEGNLFPQLVDCQSFGSGNCYRLPI